MKLYGSTTSPYVRRIRLLLEGKDYEFINMDVFAEQGRKALTAKNPTLKVPFLEDGEQILFDSRVIFRYLSEKWSLQKITWSQENQLTLIDAANDSLVQLLLLSRSGFNTDTEAMYFDRQKCRIAEVFAELDQKVSNGDFSQWYYPAICLYSLLDWCQFRDLFDFTNYQHLQGFLQEYQSQPGVLATDPR